MVLIDNFNYDGADGLTPLGGNRVRRLVPFK
jgi:hypothetical protein